MPERPRLRERVDIHAEFLTVPEPLDPVSYPKVVNVFVNRLFSRAAVTVGPYESERLQLPYGYMRLNSADALHDID